MADLDKKSLSERDIRTKFITPTVEKTNGLMALCDRLEAQLTTTHTESRRLLESILHEALAPAR